MNISEIYIAEQERHRAYITNFRVSRCFEKCSQKECLKLHTNQSPRRVPLPTPDGNWNYLPKMCKNLNSCKMGDRCHFAHSRSECSYHPLLYKVNDCKIPSKEIGKCSKWGFDCSFAHEAPDRRTKGLQKLLPERVTYKTLRCMQNLCKDQECVYFHTNNERRRPQGEFEYDCVPCKFVFVNRSFLNPDHCPLKDRCNLAHTKNEIYYHLKVFRTKVCKSKPCYSPFCAFIHDEENEGKGQGGQVLGVEVARMTGDAMVEKGQFEGVEGKGISQKVAEEVKADREDIVKDGKNIDSLSNSEETVIREKSETKSKKEAQNNIPAKLRCKICGQREIKFIFDCGSIVCGKCLTSICQKCGRAHVARIDL